MKHFGGYTMSFWSFPQLQVKNSALKSDITTLILPRLWTDSILNTSM